MLGRAGRARTAPAPARPGPGRPSGRRSASPDARAALSMSITPERRAEVEVVARLEVELRRLADLAHDLRVLLGCRRPAPTGRAGWAATAAAPRSGSRPPPAPGSSCLISPDSSRIAAISPSASRPSLRAAAISSETRFWRARRSSTSGSSSRRRASSSSSSSISPAAPRRASAALTPSGSCRISLRSSVPACGSLAATGRPAAGRRPGLAGLGDGGLLALVPAFLATNAATASASCADHDVLGHDRAGEAAVADRVEHLVRGLVALVEVRAASGARPSCPACRPPSSVWQPAQRSANSCAPRFPDSGFSVPQPAASDAAAQRADQRGPGRLGAGPAHGRG